MTALVAAHLQRRGFLCEQLHDSTRTLQSLVAFQPQIVLLDVDMAELDGLQVLRQIQSYDAGICVIMVTGVTSLKVLNESQHSGADDCVFKPLASFAELDAAIARAESKLAAWDELFAGIASRRREFAPSVYTPDFIAGNCPALTH
jgi:DNA-binding response OmpR family regulator